MLNYKYETHIIKDPLLPFIFRPRDQHAHRACPTNWHENIEILSCISGTGYVKCGMEEFFFSAGDIFVVNADIPHSIGSKEHIAYRCLIIDNSFCAANGIPISQLHFQNTIRDAELARLFEAVAVAYDLRSDDPVRSVSEIRYAVLGLLRKLWADHAVPRQQSMPTESDVLIKKALTCIRENLSGHITLDLIADCVGVSKYHLSRQFKSFTGSTVIHTVNLIRCTEAKRLIEGGMRVSDAAVACGFENLSYFTRTFKKLIGAVPSSLLPGKSSDNVRQS